MSRRSSLSAVKTAVSRIVPQSARRQALSYIESTVTRAEDLARHFTSREPEKQELVPRIMGIVSGCIEYNTAVGERVPQRLYRIRSGATKGERSLYPGRIDSKTRARVKGMRDGRMGAKIQMFSEMGAEVEEVPQHEILDYIMAPNPLFAGGTLSYMRMRGKWAFGEAYEEIIDGTNGFPIMANPLYPQYTRPVFSKHTLVEKYVYGRDTSDTRDIPGDEVIFYKHRPSLRSPLRGESPLAAVLPEADLIFKNMMHDMAFVEGGQRPDSIVSLKGEGWKPEHVAQLEKRLEQLARGGIASVKALVTRGELEWNPLSYPPKDLSTTEKLERYDKVIRFLFGHTESMADSTETNVASAVIGLTEQFLNGTILPALINDASEMTTFLIPRFGYDPCVYFFAPDDPVTADLERQDTRVRNNWQNGLTTLNEARVESGRPEIDDPRANEVRVNGLTLEALDTQPGAQSPLAALFSGLGGGGTEKPASDQGGGDEHTSADTLEDIGEIVADAEGSDATVEISDEGVVGADDTDAVAVVGDAQDDDLESPEPPPEEPAANMALNGAQIQQLVDLAVSVAEAKLDPETAREIALSAFPGIAPERIDRIFGSITPGGGITEEQTDELERETTKALGTLGAIAKKAFQPMACTSCGCVTKAADITGDVEFDDEARGFLDELLDDLEGILGKMQRDSLQAAFAANAADHSESIRALEEALLNRISPVVEKMAEQMLDGFEGTDALGDGFVPTSAVEAFKEHVPHVASDIAASTDTVIKPIVQRGLEQGLGRAQIAKELEAAGLPKYRAEMIARTELSNAYNSGRYETLHDLGVEKYIVVNAPNPSEAHREIAKRGAKEYGEPFVIAGEVIKGEKIARTATHPPFRPNCRCRIEEYRE